MHFISAYHIFYAIHINKRKLFDFIVKDIKKILKKSSYNFRMEYFHKKPRNVSKKNGHRMILFKKAGHNTVFWTVMRSVESVEEHF